jgi:hypothetical protein
MRQNKASCAKVDPVLRQHDAARQKMREHRAEPKVRISDPQGHASEKWTQDSAKNDALEQKAF